MGSSEILKVRLTAEGIQDVVNSLKKVEGQVGKTAKAGKDATDALGSLGTIFAAQRLAAFVAGALDAADSLFKMSQKTGVAVEQLSVFSHQAQQAEVSNQDLSAGFARLSKSMDALAAGEAGTVEAFKRIGLSAEEFKGLSLDQVMLKIANAQAGFSDGAGKAAVMMQIFGKSGSNLIPLLHDLANGGFENAKTKLQELGLVISGDMAKASQDFNDSMTRMKMAAQGAAVQVSQGLLPGMTHSIDALTKALAGMPIAAKAFAGSFLAIGTAATAASVAVKVLYGAIVGLGPIGLAVVAISAMTAGVIAWNAAEAAAQAEAVNTNSALRDRVTTGKKLVDAYAKEVDALERGNLSAKARKEHEDKLKQIKEDLIKLSPDYKTALDKETDSLKKQADAMRTVNELQQEDLKWKRKILEAEIQKVQAEISLTESGDKQLEADRKMQEMALGVSQYGGSGGYGGQLRKRQAALQAQRDALSPSTGMGLSTGKSEITGTTGTDAPATPRAAVAELTAQSKREYELQKQNLESMLGLTEDAYKDGLLSFQDYMEGRKALLEMGTKAELDMIQQQIVAEEQARDGAKKPEDRQAAQTKIDDLNNQLNLKRLEGEQRFQALEREGQDKGKAAAQEFLRLEAELEEAKGRTGAKALEVIQAEYDARIATAQKDPEKAALLTEMQRLALLKTRSEIAGGEGNQATATMQNSMSSIDQDQAAGKIGSPDADQKRIQAYQAWLPVMEQVYQKQKQIADESGNPVLIANAEALRIQIEGVNNSVAQLSNEWAGVQQAGANALASGMVETLMQIGNGAGAVADSFRSMAQSIIQSIQQAIVKMMMLQAMQAMFGGSASGSFGAAMIGAFSGHAEGGLIRGPGTGTSDSIMARLSTGEFVQRAAAVDYYGADFMRALNGLQIPKGTFPRYAEGGLVASAPQQSIKGDFTHQIGLTLDRGIVAEYLQSPEGARVMATQVMANSKRFNAALGR